MTLLDHLALFAAILAVLVGGAGLLAGLAYLGICWADQEDLEGDLDDLDGPAGGDTLPAPDVARL